MARASNRLTAVGIAKAKKPGMLPDGHGLYLQVSLTGGKSWIFRYKRAGKTHDVGLGPSIRHRWPMPGWRCSICTNGAWMATIHWPSNAKRRRAYPVIGDLSVQAVDTALVMKILEPIWKTKPQMRITGEVARESAMMSPTIPI